MDKILSENLFLLEFLVDKVNILPGSLPRDIVDVTGETCVSFQFLDNDPLDICEEDFTPHRDYSNDSGNMKNGKSCLFAIAPHQVDEAMQKFDVQVNIFKKLTNGCLPDKLQIGYAEVPLAGVFNEILSLLQSKQETGTISRTLKESYPITGQSNDDIGDIAVFVRMSCFGKLIVTQFQMNLEEKSVFFKDKEGKTLYKYRKASQQEQASSRGEPHGNGKSGGRPSTVCPKQEECHRWNDAIGSKSQSADYDDGTCRQCNLPPEPLYPPCQEPMPPCMPQPVCMSPPVCHAQPCCMSPAPCWPPSPPMQPPCIPPPCMPPPPPKGCYQEIGAEMNGNALTIRVHKNKGLSVRKVDGDGSQMSDGCYCGGQPKNQNKQQAPQIDGCGCLPGGQYLVDPCACMPQPPPCDGKQVLSLKPADDPNNPFTFKMSGCGASGKENITVVPPCSTRTDGMQVTELSDPSKDVFILRIGKKSEGADKKANLELELVTPKAPDKKPIPKKETRDTQYADSDIPGGKGGKAGKGGKGGKSKKGKGKK